MASPAAAAGCSTCLHVVIVGPNGARRDGGVFTQSQIDGARDLVHDEGGGTAEQTGNEFYTFATATSVYKVLTDPDLLGRERLGPVDSVEISDAALPALAATLTTRQGDLAEPGVANYSAGRAPAFFFDGSGPQSHLVYARPKRADGDQSGGSLFVPGSSSSSFTMTVYTRAAPYEAKVVAETTTTVSVGQSVTFNTTFTDGREPSGTARYFWNFGDGSLDPTSCAGAGTTRKVTHKFTRAGGGGFPVHVSVCGDGQTVPVRSINEIKVTVGPTPKPSAGPAKGSGTDKNGTADGASKGTGKNANGSETGGTGTTSDAKGAGAQAGTEAQRTLKNSFDGNVSVAGVLLSADKATPLIIDTSASPSVKAAASRRPGEIPRDWRWLLGLLPVVLLAGGMVRQTRWLAPRLPQPPWRST